MGGSICWADTYFRSEGAVYVGLILISEVEGGICSGWILIPKVGGSSMLGGY